MFRYIGHIFAETKFPTIHQSSNKYVTLHKKHEITYIGTYYLGCILIIAAFQSSPRENCSLHVIEFDQPFRKILYKPSRQVELE